MDGRGDDMRGDDPFARLGPVFAGRRALLLEDDPGRDEAKTVLGIGSELLAYIRDAA